MHHIIFSIQCKLYGANVVYDACVIRIVDYSLWV